jgi:hypothetical protein
LSESRRVTLDVQYQAAFQSVMVNSQYLVASCRYIVLATMYDVASFCVALKYVGSISLETLHDRTDLIFFGILNA